MFDNPEFQALRREYIAGAMDRCAHLQEETGKLKAGGDVDLKSLRQEIHKFRGSGGFYGFSALSGAAARAEDQLVLVLDGEAPRDDSLLAVLVDAVVATLQAAAQEVTP
jgi:HPt (histidine-containing phosphotransfer) domain-containing protein